MDPLYGANAPPLNNPGGIARQVRRGAASLRVAAAAALGTFGAYDPDVLKTSSRGQRNASYRAGAQIILGGSIVWGASYAAMMTALGPEAPRAALFCVATVASGAIVLLDIAAVEKARQMRAEVEAKAFHFRCPRSSGSLAKLAALAVGRLALAGCTSTFFATVLLTVMLQKDISAVLAEHAVQQNQPVITEIINGVDTEIAARKADLDNKDKVLLALRAQPPSSPPPAPGIDPAANSLADQATAPFNQRLAQLIAAAAALAKQQEDTEVEIGRLSQDMHCEEQGMRCDAANPRIQGKGPKFRLAQEMLADAEQRLADIKQRIADNTRAQTDVPRDRAAALVAQQQASAAALVAQRQAATAQSKRYDDVVTNAQAAADTALAAYSSAVAGRTSAIARRESESSQLAQPRQGLSAALEALDELSHRRGHWLLIASLKALVVLLELNALAAAVLWPTRQAAPVKEFVGFVTETEEAVFQGERKRRQRPPLDAYGRS